MDNITRKLMINRVDSANTRLTALAPELLDQLEQLALYLEEAHQEDIMSGHGGDDQRKCSYCKALEKASKLICKARGAAQPGFVIED